MGHLSTSPIFLLILVVVVTLMVGVASGQSDCQGKVGSYAYDLTPLARELAPWTCRRPTAGAIIIIIIND
jgi:hypothetical protein